ncbi:MAG: Cna B-type domain-containing protein, partial [Erysipelotrichaceae bacterium]|nr:Cna B-type domain-containing protein [Erysipelotrichaceae bacterium]
VTLNEDNDWEATVEHLPVYDDNNEEIEYTWTEGDMPEGYELTDTSVDGKITTLTNTLMTEATVIKVWHDDENESNNRPEELEVVLKGGEEEVTTVTLNEENGWTATVEHLPVYDDDNNEIEYTWTEGDLPDNYQLESQKTEGKVTTITNTILTEATVIKVWNDKEDQDRKRPDSLTVVLSNGEETVETVTLNDDNDWTVTVTGLPKYADGVEVIYTWTEDEEGLPEGYELTSKETEGTVTTFTNSYSTEETQTTVKKVWDDADNQDGKRPDSITVYLSDGTSIIRTVVLNEANSWTCTIEHLDKYDDGVKIEYTWTEDEAGLPEGYVLSNTEVEGTITTLTNSYTPEETEVPVIKIWEDHDDKDRKRPDSITVHLFADGEEVASVEITKEGNWEYTFEGLPKYSDGEEIDYTITEDPVEGYTTVIDGYTVYNRLPPNTGDSNHFFWLFGLMLPVIAMLLVGVMRQKENMQRLLSLVKGK